MRRGLSLAGPKRLAGIAAAFIAVRILAVAAFDAADKAWPLHLAPEVAISTEILDRDGVLLRPFATQDGRWRLPVSLQQVDRQFMEMLVAYEDRRFWSHPGVDVAAMARAALQFVAHGRIVSGASTLTMQLARLEEPRAPRGLSAKLRQMFRALQLERALTKEQILGRYLTLAPYGGNIEGVRAASLAWFGKEPRKLALHEAALLVALPQAPEARRPDRQPERARMARDRVLQRMADARAIEPREVARAAALPLEAGRRAMPALAPHLADMARDAAAGRQTVRLTLSAERQTVLEGVADAAARRLGANLSVAIVLADAVSGDILAEVGSADYFNRTRAGWVGMSRARRSPGSTLKPFVYALALEDGVVAPATILSDRPANFSGYRPRNFDTTYQGDVTVTQALQLSLNVPAVLLLEAVGPARLLQMLRRSGVHPVLPKAEEPGLAIGLGGLGVSLVDLVQAYGVLANGGMKVRLVNGLDVAAWEKPQRVLSERAAGQVTAMLAGIPAPAGAAGLPIAYKTGTSYGYRDAWAVGYDGRHVLGVWVGRADNGAVPGATGGGTAAPILFEAFSKVGGALSPLRFGPAEAAPSSSLVAGLKRFVPRATGLVPARGDSLPPEIVYPPRGARIELARDMADGAQPLVLKLQGGRPPFRWVANGIPVQQASRRRNFAWQPSGSGISTLTVIDAAGKAASVEVFLDIAPPGKS